MISKLNHHYRDKQLKGVMKDLQLKFITTHTLYVYYVVYPTVSMSLQLTAFSGKVRSKMSMVAVNSYAIFKDGSRFK